MFSYDAGKVLSKMTQRALITLVLLFSVGAPVGANIDLAKSKNCMSCHALNRKVIGPSYDDVAQKYAGQKDVADKLALKVRQGGAGVWGVNPMPANRQVSEAEARMLVNWILKH